MSIYTKSCQKFRTIRGTPQKCGGFWKAPILFAANVCWSSWLTTHVILQKEVDVIFWVYGKPKTLEQLKLGA